MSQSPYIFKRGLFINANSNHEKLVIFHREMEIQIKNINKYKNLFMFLDFYIFLIYKKIYPIFQIFL